MTEPDLIQKLPGDVEQGRWCSYKQLMAAIQRARAAGYNRQLPAHIVKRLDPQGINTFQFVMIHEHIDQVHVEHPHVRAYAYVKLRGRKPAFELHLDIPLVCWRAWPTDDRQRGVSRVR